MLKGRICTRVYGPTIIRRTVFGGTQTKDPYKLLGVNRNASDAEIKEAYLKKVKLLHPDLNPGPKAAMQFMEVKQAYDLIGKSDKRKIHRTAESVGKNTGFDDAMKRAMGNQKDWMSDFENAQKTTEDRFNRRKQQRQQFEQPDFEMGKKANMSAFEEWEKEHYEKLSRKPVDRYGMPKRFKDMTPEEMNSKKKHVVFFFGVTFTLLLLSFMDI
ncbi:chaperone protein DnaJ-like [Bolinopsis microptera]|uniref:chaperone protein DnaJ-like n=1 Tax=Bolinopsis microptera TaxID=2820187 RepID=UPI00307A6067